MDNTKCKCKIVQSMTGIRRRRSLFEAKNAGIAKATSSIFNEE